MKKILFGLIATAFMSINTNAQDKSIDLNFGKISSYSGECLSGKGFCSGKSTVTINDNIAYAGLSRTSEGKIAIQLNELYYRKISSNLVDGCIVVDKDFSLPKDLLDSVGVYREYFIKAGKYKAVVSKDSYTFTF